MSTAAIARTESDPQSTASQAVALPLRHDTFLGVCEAIGEDFGFNPNWLRVAFAPFILISPLLTLGAYLALGLLVMLSRKLFPVAARGATANVPTQAAEQNRHDTEERLAA